MSTPTVETIDALIEQLKVLRTKVQAPQQQPTEQLQKKSFIPFNILEHVQTHSPIIVGVGARLTGMTTTIISLLIDMYHVYEKIYLYGDNFKNIQATSNTDQLTLGDILTIISEQKRQVETGVLPSKALVILDGFFTYSSIDKQVFKKFLDEASDHAITVIITTQYAEMIPSFLKNPRRISFFTSVKDGVLVTTDNGETLMMIVETNSLTTKIPPVVTSQLDYLYLNLIGYRVVNDKFGYQRIRGRIESKSVPDFDQSNCLIDLASQFKHLHSV